MCAELSKVSLFWQQSSQ